jgi:hypothetical protein
MWAHEHMAHERRFDKTTDCQALLPEFSHLTIFGWPRGRIRV